MLYGGLSGAWRGLLAGFYRLADWGGSWCLIGIFAFQNSQCEKIYRILLEKRIVCEGQYYGFGSIDRPREIFGLW